MRMHHWKVAIEKTNFKILLILLPVIRNNQLSLKTCFFAQFCKTLKPRAISLGTSYASKRGFLVILHHKLTSLFFLPLSIFNFAWKGKKKAGFNERGHKWIIVSFLENVGWCFCSWGWCIVVYLHRLLRSKWRSNWMFCLI